MNDEQIVLRTATGVPLVIPAEARAHLVAHPTVCHVLEEAAAHLTLPEAQNVYAVEIDLGRSLEPTTLLPAPVLELDTPASFALRVNRAHASRVTEETPTTWDSTVVIRVTRAAPEMPFELATAYVGRLGPLEPWDAHLASKAEYHVSLDFWSRNALVFDSQIMQPIFTSSWGEVLRNAQSPFL